MLLTLLTISVVLQWGAIVLLFWVVSTTGPIIGDLEKERIAREQEEARHQIDPGFYPGVRY